MATSCSFKACRMHAASTSVVSFPTIRRARTPTGARTLISAPHARRFLDLSRSSDGNGKQALRSITRLSAEVNSSNADGTAATAASNGDATTSQLTLAGGQIVGIGGVAPAGVVTNHDLEALVETNDEWITTRTGIKERHVIAEGESMTELTAQAARQALEMAGVSAEELDMVLMCTSTPDDLFGGACKVQAAIGAKNAVAFDLTAACSGFILGVVTAFQFIKTGSMQKV